MLWKNKILLFDNFIFLKKVLMHFAVTDKDNEAGGAGLEEVFVMGQRLAEGHLRGYLDKILVTILKIHHDGGWSVPEMKRRYI